MTRPRITFELLVWVGVSAVLAYHLFPLLGGELPAGWDLASHYYLVSSLIAALQRGELLFYDPNWLGGYPAFSLHPPLMYLLLALPTLLSFGAVPALPIFNLFVFLTPFLFLATLAWAAHEWGGAVARRWAPIAGLLYLTLGREHAFSAVGLYGAVHIGFLNSFFATTLLLALIAQLARVRNGGRRTELLLCALLLAAIILSHLMTALFALFLVVIALVVFERSAKTRVLIASAGGLLLSSWWLLEVARTHWLSSAAPAPGTMLSIDPLFILYPEVNLRSVLNLLSYEEMVPSLHAAARNLPRAAAIVLHFPYAGLLLLAGSVLGVIRLLRCQRSFPVVAYLVGLLLLPRDLLFDLRGPSVHFYRFVQPLFSLNLLLASVGFGVVGSWFARREGGVAHFARPMLMALLVLALTVISFYRFGFFRSNIDSTFRTWPHHLRLSEYPEYRDGVAFVEYLASLRASGALTGRVAVETVEDDAQYLGSPNFFSALLPLHGVPVANSFLIESSLSSGFLNAALSAYSRQLLWGRVPLAFDRSFQVQSPDEMLLRLGELGVGYVIASSWYFDHHLRNAEGAELLLTQGRFNLYRLSTLQPFAGPLSRKPVLLVGEVGAQRDFVDHWFKLPHQERWPLLYTRDPLTSLTGAEMAQLCAVLYLRGSPRDSLEGLIPKLSMSGTPSVVIDAWKFPPRDRALFSLTEASRRLEALACGLSHLGSLGELRVDPERISGKGKGPIAIRATYAPRWQPQAGAERVFVLAPSQMAILADGPFELRYR